MARLVRKRPPTVAQLRRREERARAAAARRRRPDVTPAQAEAATARLDPLYGIVIVEDDPLAPDATYYADLGSDVPPIVQDMGARVDADSKRRKRAPRPALSRTPRTATPTRVRSLPNPAAAVAVVGRLVCPRCGRTDWRANGIGLQWHLDNYPACASQARKPEHTYQTEGV